MKRLFFCLPVLLFSLATNIVWAQGDSCKAYIKGNTEYAQWGIELRQAMLRECGSQPSKRCQQKYEKIIDEQSKKNSEQINKAFPKATETDPALIAAVERDLGQILAARNGLTGVWRSAKEIADFQYRLCKGLPLEDPKPSARGGRGYPPMPPPMMPIEPSISSRLSPMQPEMSGGSSFGSCNNYNYLGPNGQAVYCQKCCYGDGNCQVICN